MTVGPGRPATRWLVVGAVLVIVVLAAVASLLASDDPDGLTKVSQDQGFDHTGQTSHGLLSYGPVAGVVGMLVVLGLVVGVARLGRRRARDHADDHARHDTRDEGDGHGDRSRDPRRAEG